MSYSNKKRIRDFIKEEYWRLVYYVRSLIEDAAHRDSEDIVSDVITRLFERADITGPIENIAAYIYRSLKNSVIDILRTRKEPLLSLDGNTDRPGYVLIDEHSSPEKEYEKKEIISAIYDAVMTLPEELKSIFIMNEIEGRTFREISDKTGIPMGTLMARKSRAQNILRSKLSLLTVYMED